ncbi:MAG TPA: hypothetical protein VGE07_01420 [Herpetosiphonaceae bacterium]
MPDTMTQGLQPKTVRTLGALDIATHLPKDAAYRSLTLIEGRNEAGELELRAFLNPRKGEPVSLGALERPFPGAPLSATLFEVGGRRFIAGVVDPGIEGKLSTIEFERVEPNQAKWMDAVKVSTINKQTFVIPIFPHEYEQWTTVRRIAVNTRESRQRGVDQGPDASHAWQQSYDPALEIGDRFAVIP